jgi:hypothetical protein
MLNPMRTSQWGWKISKTKFPAIQGERKKNHAAYNGEKKYHAKESAQKKFLHVNLPTLLTSVYCVHRLARFCIFEQAHLLKRTPILPPLEPLTYDSQWRSLAKLLPPPPRKSGLIHI